MDETTTLGTQVEDASVGADAAADTAEPVDEELLIDEVSIDGMCGVY